MLEEQVEYPLVVDMDGTLILSDMSQETVLRMLSDSPLRLLSLPFWLLKGIAYTKSRLVDNRPINPAVLPYNDTLIEWLKLQKAQGRKLILCTGAHETMAQQVSAHVGIFDEVHGSDGVINLVSHAKADFLVRTYGEKKFDYVGNSSQDIAVWKVSRHAIVVNASSSVTTQAKAIAQVQKIIPPLANNFQVWERVFRGHQWLKNLLLFVPLLTAHHFSRISEWQSLFLAFLAFGLGASAVYICNDLLDLENDRCHPRKRHRPFASGRVPILRGIQLAPLLVILSLSCAHALGYPFMTALGFYFFCTALYTVFLKKIALVDCLTLAGLYTLRVIAGAAVIAVPLSFWLLAFSVFIFLSLAFIKRYAELEIERAHNKQRIHGRGYYPSDASILQTLGIASGYAAVLVLALYIDSGVITSLYHKPEMVWGMVPVMLFWVSWMWMQAHRGKMHDDPLVFAVKDPTSWVVVILLTILFIGAVL